MVGDQSTNYTRLLDQFSYTVAQFKKEIKSSLYSLNTLSGVTSERCSSPWLCAKAHTINVATMASHWQRMGDLISSGFEPHTSRTRSECLNTCVIWSVFLYNNLVLKIA